MTAHKPTLKDATHSIEGAWHTLMWQLAGPSNRQNTSNVGYAVGANQARRSLHALMRSK